MGEMSQESMRALCARMREIAAERDDREAYARLQEILEAPSPHAALVERLRGLIARWEAESAELMEDRAKAAVIEDSDWRTGQADGLTDCARELGQALNDDPTTGAGS